LKPKEIIRLSGLHGKAGKKCSAHQRINLDSLRVLCMVLPAQTDEPDRMSHDVSRGNAEARDINPSESCVTLH
jgi:hypothetical protein